MSKVKVKKLNEVVGECPNIPDVGDRLFVIDKITTTPIIEKQVIRPGLIRVQTRNSIYEIEVLDD